MAGDRAACAQFHAVEEKRGGIRLRYPGIRTSSSVCLRRFKRQPCAGPCIVTKWYQHDAEVAALSARGLSRKQIADAIGISWPTVNAILSRLGRPTPDRGSRRSIGFEKWRPVRDRFLAECERLGLPPTVALAREMGVTRQRAHQILQADYSPRGAIPAAERFIERVRHVKPKPKQTKRQARKAEAERKRAALAAKRKEWADLVATVDAMTSGYGQRCKAASEMGLHGPSLSAICSRYRPIGETTAAKLAAWVERHQS